MGGVETDLDGRTSVEALFAAGEVACSGVHGANRLASNSLLEGLAFGARRAQAMTELLGINLPSTDDVRTLMWSNCGSLRDRERMEVAIGRLEEWHSLVRTAPASKMSSREFRRLGGIVTVGLLIARAALRRQESRGGHFRSDFPDRDDIK